MTRTGFYHGCLVGTARLNERVDRGAHGDGLFLKGFPGFDGLIAGEYVAICVDHDTSAGAYRFELIILNRKFDHACERASGDGGGCG